MSDWSQIFMDTFKTMGLSWMNVKLNNAVVFANIKTSALRKKEQWVTPSFVSQIFGLVPSCKNS